MLSPKRDIVYDVPFVAFPFAVAYYASNTHWLASAWLASATAQASQHRLGVYPDPVQLEFNNEEFYAELEKTLYRNPQAKLLTIRVTISSLLVRRTRVFNNRRFGFVLAITALGSGTWILAKQAQDSTPKLERQAVAYSIYNPNNDAVMLDSLSGKTWMLRRMEDGKPTWLPISRVDSEKEAVHLWKKISDHAERTGKNETNLPLDVLLKDRGYLGIPLDRLKRL